MKPADREHKQLENTPSTPAEKVNHILDLSNLLAIYKKIFLHRVPYSSRNLPSQIELAHMHVSLALTIPSFAKLKQPYIPLNEYHMLAKQLLLATSEALKISDNVLGTDQLLTISLNLLSMLNDKLPIQQFTYMQPILQILETLMIKVGSRAESIGYYFNYLKQWYKDLKTNEKKIATEEKHPLKTTLTNNKTIKLNDKDKHHFIIALHNAITLDKIDLEKIDPNYQSLEKIWAGLLQNKLPKKIRHLILNAIFLQIIVFNNPAKNSASLQDYQNLLTQTLSTEYSTALHLYKKLNFISNTLPVHISRNILYSRQAIAQLRKLIIHILQNIAFPLEKNINDIIDQLPVLVTNTQTEHRQKTVSQHIQIYFNAISKKLSAKEIAAAYDAFFAAIIAKINHHGSQTPYHDEELGTFIDNDYHIDFEMSYSVNQPSIIEYIAIFNAFLTQLPTKIRLKILNKNLQITQKIPLVEKILKLNAPYDLLTCIGLLYKSISELKTILSREEQTKEHRKIRTFAIAEDEFSTPSGYHQPIEALEYPSNPTRDNKLETENTIKTSHLSNEQAANQFAVYTRNNNKQLLCYYLPDSSLSDHHNLEIEIRNAASIGESLALSTPSFKSIKAPEHTAPFLISATLQALPHLTKSYEHFISKATKINARNSGQHRINLEKLLYKNQSILCQLMVTFDQHCFPLLSTQLAGTLLTLERHLSSLYILPKPFVNILRELAQKEKWNAITSKKMQKWKNIITSLWVIIKITIQTKSDCALMETIIDKVKKLSTDKCNQNSELLLKELLDWVLNIYIKELDLEDNLLSDSDSDTSSVMTQTISQRIFSRIPATYFIRLIQAAETMRINNRYRKTFFDMLICDITGASLDDYLHQTDNENDNGAAIAKHNKKIHDLLSKANINPKAALNYKKTYDFYYSSDRNFNPQSAHHLLASCKRLWLYLLQLEKRIDKNIDLIEHDKHPYSTIKNQLKSINKKIQQIKNSLAKKKGKNDSSATATIDILTLQKQMHNLNKIYKNCIAILKQYKNLCPAAILEFIEHYKEEFAALKPLLEGISSSTNENTSHNKQHKAAQHLRVQQWPKAHPLTFFLGDDVGCCLATTNSQFAAMVQRRLDDAMLFHVVTEVNPDGSNGKPIALAWLYFGVNNNKIYLVANFLEIDAKYGSSEDAGPVITQALLHFCDQYCKDFPAIAGFYLNPLTYGNQTSALDRFNKVNIKFSKLGGAFNPESSYWMDLNSPNDTANFYYLASLHVSNFHRYDANKITPEELRRFTPIKKEKIARNIARFSLLATTTSSLKDATETKHEESISLLK